MSHGSDQPLDPQLLASIEHSNQGTLVDRMGIEFTVITRDRLEATMPVEGNRQIYGLMHGGASCVLAETVASIGAALNAWPERIAVGISLSATHHRSATEGQVRAVGRPLHRGRTLSSWSVEVTDDGGRLICSASVTCALRENQPV